jgi:hypothetical protein
MAEEEEQDAHMEKIAAPAQRARAQHLRGIALPGVLTLVEAYEAPEDEHREADIGIHLKQESVQGTHGAILLSV